MENKTYWIETYGCQMNIAESNAIELELLQHGLIKAKSAELTDCVIINTCSVRKTAENRVWGRLTYYHHIKKNRNITIVVTGCMAERLKEDLKKEASFVDYVLGTNDKVKIARILSNKVVKTESDKFTFNASYYKEGDYKSYIPILNGCNNFCTYCIVPYVRGREVSRSIDSIINEVKFLETKGVREITLLGQNVNSYNFDGLNFVDLLKIIIKNSSYIERIRFESPHPKDFSDELINLIAKEDKIANHIHLPLQSGSDKILKEMHRRYDTDRYMSIVNKLRLLNPNITFVADLMVGFPGETQKDFEDTLKMVKKVGFVESFMYYYNPRPNTAAVTYDNQIDKEVKLERLQKLIDLQREISLDYKKTLIGKTLKVLVESTSKKDKKQFMGRTVHDMMLVFTPINKVVEGTYTNVKVIDVKGNTLIAIEVDS